jgi:hypothetical protein
MIQAKLGQKTTKDYYLGFKIQMELPIYIKLLLSFLLGIHCD